MAKQNPTTELSPLDQIRLAEAEIIRKTMSAHEDTERRLADARAQAVTIKKDAREKGIQAGKVHYKEIISRAEEEAKAITAHAKNQARKLQKRGHAQMDKAVQYVLDIVLGLGGTHES